MKTFFKPKFSTHACYSRGETIALKEAKMEQCCGDIQTRRKYYSYNVSSWSCFGFKPSSDLPFSLHPLLIFHFLFQFSFNTTPHFFPVRLIFLYFIKLLIVGKNSHMLFANFYVNLCSFHPFYPIVSFTFHFSLALSTSPHPVLNCICSLHRVSIA